LTGEAGITFNKYMYSKLPYDTMKDYVGITRLVQVHAILTVPAALPAKDAKEFVALMKKYGANMNYGSPGIGDPMHIGMEWFKNVAKFDLTHVPYKGGAAALQGILRGDVQAVITSGLTAEQHIKSGKLKVLVVSGKKRMSLFPDVQTLAEAGYPDVAFGYYLAMLAPAGTPKKILDKIATDVRTVMNEPAFKSKFVDPYDNQLINDSPDEFASFLKEDIVKAEAKVKVSGAKLD
jgi:tripartite-type tricarboxylate transporter receptor subunit TctC